MKRMSGILTLVATTWLYAALPAALAVDPDASRDAKPAFRPVDTSRLMGSPDPMEPLGAELAFPNLKFDKPVALGHVADGSNRMWVVTQDGMIFLFPCRRDVKQSEVKTLLDVRPLVLRDDFEEGCLGLAFHPQFRENGRFFIFHSAKPRSTVIAEYHIAADDPNRADPASRKVVLSFAKPFGNHNGGTLVFGPDGKLYIAVGDGGSPNDVQGNGQNLGVLLAKVLRIDVDRRDPGKAYAVPPDNPFVDRPDARGEIWAYGLRNPWRMSFDPATGVLWLADVGQDLWEEIDLIVRGGNYGWSVREGKHSFGPNGVGPNKDMIEPIFDYPHTDGRSIIGGVVYRGKRLPELQGTYIYADFVAGRLAGLKWDGKRITSNHRLVPNPVPEITAFGYDADGEVYFANYEGRILQLHRQDWGMDPRKPPFPRLLSQTGLFESVGDLQPVEGVLPYDVNVPLYSDEAVKDRYLALPTAKSVEFSESGRWEFPVGTVFIKHFFLDLTRGDPSTRRRLETRLMVHHRWGWDGYTFKWNESQTDAELLDAADSQTFAIHMPEGVETQTWNFPSRTDCRACHTRVEKFILGASTRQLNRSHDYGHGPENQLARWERLGVFSKPLPKVPEQMEAFPDWRRAAAPANGVLPASLTSTSYRPNDEALANMPTRPIAMGTPAQIAARAKAYVDVHCAVCHTPKGTGYTRIDMRYSTPLENMFLVNQIAERPRPGLQGSKLIVPGDPTRSELLPWLHGIGTRQMPPLGRTMVDADALAVLTQWVLNMPHAAPPPSHTSN